MNTAPGVSFRTVFNPITPASRFARASLPSSAQSLSTKPFTTSATDPFEQFLTNGGKHFTANVLTSPLWSSSWRNTAATTFFSTSGAARNESFDSSASRSLVAMYRKSVCGRAFERVG